MKRCTGWKLGGDIIPADIPCPKRFECACFAIGNIDVMLGGDDSIMQPPIIADSGCEHHVATTVAIEGEAGGEFIVIEQPGLVDAGKIRISPAEWTALKAAIDRMIGECRPMEIAK